MSVCGNSSVNGQGTTLAGKQESTSDKPSSAVTTRGYLATDMWREGNLGSLMLSLHFCLTLPLEQGSRKIFVPEEDILAIA